MDSMVARAQPIPMAVAATKVIASDKVNFRKDRSRIGWLTAEDTRFADE